MRYVCKPPCIDGTITYSKDTCIGEVAIGFGVFIVDGKGLSRICIDE